MPDAVRSALFVNLLTEDNLPYYFHTIERMFGATTMLGHLGPAVDGRGGPALDRHPRLPHRHPGDRSRRARAGAHGAGDRPAQVPEPDDGLDGFVYVALQELATRIAHHNTGKLLDDQGRLRRDEEGRRATRTFTTSSTATSSPRRSRSTRRPWCCAIERQVRTFEMPGTGIIDFDAHALAIAKAGIYDFDDPPRPDPRAGRAAPLGRRVAQGLTARQRRRVPRSSSGSTASAGRVAASPARRERQRPRQRRRTPVLAVAGGASPSERLGLATGGSTSTVTSSSSVPRTR